jgi:hypothetical protein
MAVKTSGENKARVYRDRVASTLALLCPSVGLYPSIKT